jgi:hypothetical protein
MRRTHGAALIVAALLVQPSLARNVGGVDLPDSIQAGGSTLALNGAGVRTKFFINLYVGALYLQSSGADAGAIVSADEPMAITLHIISDKITSDRMVEATEEGFEHSTGGNTAPLKESIDAFMAFFREPIANGDVFEIGYVPPSGEIRVSKNGEPKGAVPGGLPFKRAVFGIWLGDKPAQKSLRDQMLGR